MMASSCLTVIGTAGASLPLPEPATTARTCSRSSTYCPARLLAAASDSLGLTLQRQYSR